MHFPDTRAGRRRAQTTTRLSDVTAALSTMSRATLVKALVGLGLATSAAAAVAIPVQASPGQLETRSQTAAFMARDRVEAVQETTSRSSGRASVSGSGVALTAPAAEQAAAVSAGPAGVTAVAKAAPKAAPTRTEEKPEEKSSDSSEDSSSKKSSTPSTVGSGVSMAFYGWCDSKGLGDNASKVCSAVRSNFAITNIGGFRAGAGDHGAGKAVDVMVTGSRGDAVAQWAIENMGAYDITYVIWKQRIWQAGSSGWRSMEDRGSATANHYDHVHISVE